MNELTPEDRNYSYNFSFGNAVGEPAVTVRKKQDPKVGFFFSLSKNETVKK